MYTPHLACMFLFWALHPSSLRGNGKGLLSLESPAAAAQRLRLGSGLPFTKPTELISSPATWPWPCEPTETVLPVDQLLLQLQKR